MALFSSQQPAPDELLKIWELLDVRNRQLGWARFDYADLDSHPWVRATEKSAIRKLVRYALRGFDVVAPVPLHTLVRMPKQVVPTAFYHVGTSYLHRERLGDWAPTWEADQADLVCEAALGRRLKAEHVCWGHPYFAHGAVWKVAGVKDAPPSCAHHVARVGTLLLEVGKAHARPDFIESGLSAARAMLAYHNWHDYEDGTCTVSYYPYTDDETINTCADVAVLFASIPSAKRPPECQSRLEAIVRMVLSEQRADGSWNYCAVRHYAKYGDGRSIDNFHSAQVIQALAKVLQRGDLPMAMVEEVRLAIEKGLDFYLTHFFRDDGSGYYFPTLKGRLSPIVGYTEGLAAIYWAIKSGALQHGNVGKRASALVPKMTAKALGFLDPATGDVASARFLGRNYHLQSLRWGSGPLMEGLMYAIMLTL